MEDGCASYLIYAPIEKLPKERTSSARSKNLAKKADSIVIATDFDREGRADRSDALTCIREVNEEAPVSRARYSAITKEEITRAFTNLVELDVDLAQAGASRQDIDLIWGAVLTRYLTLVKFAGYGNVRSSGRVQTPTLALIVARERERLAFVPEDYWVIKGDFSRKDLEFSANHATARFKVESEADEVMEHVAGATSARVAAIEEATQAGCSCSVQYHFAHGGCKRQGDYTPRTMRLAKTSTWMVSSRIRALIMVYPSSLDLRDILKRISGNPAYRPFAEELLKKDKLTATRGKTETTDHPPIHPTNLATPEMLPPAEYKLYNLIARRFMATLSEPAVIEGTKVTLEVNGEPFAAKGDVLVKPGFRAIYPYGLKKDEQLPALEEGEMLDFGGATKTHKQTEPPARYSQGKLIKRWRSWGWVRNRPAIPSSSVSMQSSMCRMTRSSLRSSALRSSMRSTSSHRISPVLP